MSLDSSLKYEDDVGPVARVRGMTLTHTHTHTHTHTNSLPESVGKTGPL